jgi:hypothetical protein
MAATAALGIMCKAPQPGRAKTRLAAALGVEMAADFSACFVRDVAAAIEAVPEQVGRLGYGVYAPAGSEAELRRILPPSFRQLRAIKSRARRHRSALNRYVPNLDARVRPRAARRATRRRTQVTTRSPRRAAPPGCRRRGRYRVAVRGD